MGRRAQWKRIKRDARKARERGIWARKCPGCGQLIQANPQAVQLMLLQARQRGETSKAVAIPCFSCKRGGKPTAAVLFGWEGVAGVWREQPVALPEATEPVNAPPSPAQASAPGVAAPGAAEPQEGRQQPGLDVCANQDCLSPDTVEEWDRSMWCAKCLPKAKSAYPVDGGAEGWV